MKAFIIGLLIWNVVLPAAAEEALAGLAQADAAYAKREDVVQAKIALEYYKRALAEDPQKVEAYWKASRTAWWIGDQSESRADQLNYFQQGMNFAKQAVTLDPNSVEGHYWLGGNSGSYGDAKGVLKSLFLIKPIRHEMAEVIRLNDHFDGGGAYRILGVVDYKVPGIAGGSRKRAKEELEKSLAFDPSSPFIHYYLAEFYMTGGDKEKARAEVDVLRSLKVSPELEPELHTLQKRSEKFL